MGLVKENYEVKKLGVVLPKAYARIVRINKDIVTNYACATFAIQSNRDNAVNKEPLEIVKVDFPLNTKEVDFKTAYETAKKQFIIKNENGEVTQTVTMPFYGWEDDIVEN